MHCQQNALDYLNKIRLQCSDIYHVEGEKFFKKQSTQSEIIILSRVVTKINKRNSEQFRTIVISNDFIYNIDKKSIKRRVQINKIYAITVSRKNSEFIIHIPEEIDLFYKSQQNRDVLVYYLCVALKLNNIQTVKIFFVDDDDISQYCMHIQTQDKNKQYQLHPKINYKELSADNFQLEYVNLMNKSRSNPIKILFIDDPLKLSLKLDDYNKSVTLATGSLSKIFLLHNKNLNQQFSVLKSIAENLIDLDLLELFLHNYKKQPFIEELESCFNYNGFIHFIFKICKAGDLYQHLKEINNFTEEQTKYIVAQVAYALGELHEKGIIFGDLKPENILMDEKGYIQLTDFGYGKLRIYQEYKKTQTINFTLDYASPEYIKHGDITRMSDWYSLGILIYELLIGIPPFYHTNFDVSLRMINRGEIHFPKNINCSLPCKDIIVRLIKQDSSQRIGFMGDFKDIQMHPWFSEINWEELKIKQIQLPYQPQLNDISQISERYFSMEQLNEDERNW